MKKSNNQRLVLLLSFMIFLISGSLLFSQTEKLDAIRAAIKATGAQWTSKESWVTRLSLEEFRKLLGAIPELAR